MSLEMNLPCPSCGFETIGEDAYGTYGICGICDWEDDQVQLANPFSSGGANSLSLYDSQIKALKNYPLEVKEVDGISRGTRWRPLSEVDKDKFESQAGGKRWPNKGIIEEHETYWAQNS
jgi:hypothetical protein